jgi:hypothetical protein
MMAVETCASSVVAPYCMLLLLPEAGLYVYIDLYTQVPVKPTPLRLPNCNDPKIGTPPGIFMQLQAA